MTESLLARGIMFVRGLSPCAMYKFLFYRIYICIIIKIRNLVRKSLAIRLCTLLGLARIILAKKKMMGDEPVRCHSKMRLAGCSCSENKAFSVSWQLEPSNTASNSVERDCFITPQKALD